MSDREKLKGKLQDLLKQATEERSHYYVGSVIREVLAFLEASRDSTPTEGVGKRVVEEWLKTMSSVPDMASNWGVMADLATRIDRALAAPRMTLDLRNATVLNVDGKPMISVWELDRRIRDQLPNVEVVT